ncbi:hypothetical protein NSI01_31990 [Pimelobacter simplex]|nr:hypothetical protein NSI01_31990 [Pimelobacter simplex]
MCITRPRTRTAPGPEGSAIVSTAPGGGMTDIGQESPIPAGFPGPVTPALPQIGGIPAQALPEP